MAVVEAKPVLVTMTVSHYSEKARWALERYGIPYKEEAHAPGFHSGAVKKYGSKTGSVPCLYIAGPASSTSGSCLDESEHILRWVDERSKQQPGNGTPLPPLYPADREAEVSRLCRLFDSRLGPASRSWSYAYTIYLPDTASSLFAPPVPALERMVASVGGWMVIRNVMVQRMHINPESGKAAAKEIENVLEEVGQLLADGRRYLTGDNLTAADITLAALAAPAVGQPYAGYKGLRNTLPQAMKADIEKYRSTPAGQFVLRLWEEDRATVL